MNIETFHAILVQVLDDVEKFDPPGKLRNLVNLLQNRISNPSEPSFTQQIDTQISDLRTTLPKLRSNSFPPIWKEYLSELGSESLIGNILLEEIESILATNGITPTIAHKELNSIAVDIEGDIESFRSCQIALKRFNIGLDTPAPDTVELGVMIPRSAVHDGMAEFGAELRKLSRIFGVFHECVHGDRPGFKLKSIASSDFSILCLLDWETAKLVASSLANLIETYKTIIGLKEKIQELLAAGVPEDKLKTLVDHASEQMEAKVKSVSEDIVTRFPDGRIQEIRKRELTIELQGALGEIATRIDEGYGFEIRLGSPKINKDNKEQDPEAARMQAVRAEQFAEISSKQQSLQYLKTEGAPILTLAGLPSDDIGKSQRSPDEA